MKRAVNGKAEFSSVSNIKCRSWKIHYAYLFIFNLVIKRKCPDKLENM